MNKASARLFPVLGPLLLVLFSAAADRNWRDLRFVDWPVYRGNKSAIQYSILDQINVTNVHRLKLAWEYHHGQPEGPSMYSNPLVIDGLLYFTTPRVNAVALDAATGKEVWL